MKIAMGNDHTAIELKNIIKEFVGSKVDHFVSLALNKFLDDVLQLNGK